MQTFALRLHPEQDLKQALDDFTAEKRILAGCIITCVGSLSIAAIRLAGKHGPSFYPGKFDILSLSGTLSPDGSHLQIAVADGNGATMGGQLVEGSLIRNTAEIVIGSLSGLNFQRKHDPETGFRELKIERGFGH